MASRRVRTALSSTLGFGLGLAAIGWAVSAVAPLTGPDASGWLPVAMIVAAVAGFLAVVLRLPGNTRTPAALLLPALGAAAGFLLAGGVLRGLGGGDPVRGPAFALSQFAHPGIWIVVAVGIAAAAAFRMGSSPHRGDHTRPLG